MALGIKDYKAVVTMGILKTKIYRSLRSKDLLLGVCDEAVTYLKECDTDNETLKKIIKESIEGVERLQEYVSIEDNQLEGSEFRHLVTCTLDTYHIPLDLNGSEVDKVSCMETIISKFIDWFKGVKFTGDPDFEYLVKELVTDIRNTYNDSFTEDMKKYVSNYDEFLNLLVNLKLVSTQELELVQSSNIFGKGSS